MVATIDQSTFATKEQLSAVDARIDNIIVNAGSTEDNAELIDMRVDVDGKRHSTAGEALRSQLKQKANLTDISSPYQFRGACLSANLPGSGNKINDTYYVTDKKCKFTWNGAAWYQSSLNESDYEEELSSLTEDLGEIDNAVFDTTTTEELVNTNPIVEDGKTLYTSTYIAIQEQSNSSIATLTNVVVGETLYISSTVANTKTSWGFTFTDDRNKTIYHYYDESLSGIADKTNIEVTVPEGATKLYVSRLSSKGKPEIFRKKVVKRKAPKSNLIDVLHGKKLLVFGDSMAYGHTIPESVWTKLLAEKHGMILTNFAQNGTTITRKTTTMSGATFLDTDSVHAKVMNNLNNPVDADYIIVFGGTNDIARNDQCPLGTIDDATSQTFYGALNAICQRLIQTYPSGNICFITPYIRNAGLANTEVCKEYIKAIHAVCEKWGGIPVFDNSVNGGVDFSQSDQIKALTMQDTYHLNEAGHLRAMHKYEVFLQGI